MTPYSLPTYKSKLDQFYKEHKESLEKHYPGITLRVLCQQVQNYILEHGILITDVYMHSPRSKFQIFLKKLEKGIPLGHICGRSYFYRSEFIVNSSVLIPRSETEILVECAVNTIKKMRKQSSSRFRILDFGTGSGAIILSIMQECDYLDCFALDISPEALIIAKKNYFHLEHTIFPHNKIEFFQSDRYSNFPAEELDLIVANPPYIKKDEDKHGVHHNVDQFEPEVALYLPDRDYKQWFFDLFTESHRKLTVGGLFLMEGHEDHLKELKILAENIGFANVKVVCDYTGRDRFLCASKNI